MAFTVNADPLYAHARIFGTPQALTDWGTGAAPRNADNDIKLDFEGWEATANISADWYDGVFVDEATLATSAGAISGKFITGLLTNDASLSAVAGIYTGINAKDDSVPFLTQYQRGMFVGWSKIGDSRILVDESNEAGYKPLVGPPGMIRHILPMSERYPVVYTDNGVHLMIPVKEPFATFGFRRLSKVGIYCKGAVCGDKDLHVFIDKNKEINLVQFADARSRTPDVTPLGYSEFIEAIAPGSEQLVMHYDSRQKRAYISGVNGGYILSMQGLGGGYANLTGVDENFVVAPSALTPLTQEFATDILDFQQRGVKTITQISLGTNVTQALQVAIDYRYTNTASFVTSGWKPVNNEGVVFPIVSGVEFRIRVRNQTADVFDIDYMGIRVKYSDKRFRRGASADTIQ